MLQTGPSQSLSVPRFPCGTAWWLCVFCSCVFSPGRIDAQELPIAAPEYRGDSERPPRREPAPRVDTAPRVDRTATRLIGRGINQGRVEQAMRAAFGARLTLESSEEIRVYRLVKDDRPLATLIFDDRRDGVLVQSAPAILDQFEVLIAALSQTGTTERLAIVSIERTDRTKLQQALDAYRRGSTQPAPAPPRDSSWLRPRYSPGGLALVNFVFQESSGEATAEEPGAAAPAENQPAEVPRGTGGLDVDVDVQTLPDLDVILLRGRDRDVQKLTEIIQELERLSRETQPQVQVYLLQHSNSEAVAEILQEVTEDLTGRRQGRVTVTPLVKPNGILLIGWGDAVEAMISLIRQLDTPVAANSQFRVYRLRHAPAQNVATAITQFFVNRQGLGPRVQALPDLRSNSVIVSAAPRDQLEVARMVRSLDTDQSEAVNRAKVVRIRNALAADIAETLSSAIESSDVQALPRPSLNC